MDSAQVNDVVLKVFHDYLKDKEIKLSSNIIDGLCLDSLDTIEIVMALEDAFNITIPDEMANNVKTVSDIAEYIKKILELSK